MVAANTSSRIFRTTSPTTRAENHCWMKLKPHAAAPRSSTPRANSAIAAVDGLRAIRSMPAEIRIGPPEPAREFSEIAAATSTSRLRCGQK